MEGHQMYFGGSVVGKASTIGIGTSPLIFTGVIWKRSKISEFWNKIAMLRWSPYVQAKFGEVVKLGPRTPEKALSIVTHTLKLHARTR